MYFVFHPPAPTEIYTTNAIESFNASLQKVTNQDPALTPNR